MITTRERLCREICKAEGVDPDLEGEGLGELMPKGQRYKMWEARDRVADALLKAFPVLGVYYETERFMKEDEYSWSLRFYHMNEPDIVTGERVRSYKVSMESPNRPTGTARCRGVGATIEEAIERFAEEFVVDFIGG